MSYIIINRKKITQLKPNILSSNCWGGLVYQDLGLPYLSPFVNMYIPAPEFIKLLSRLEFYIAQPLRFAISSKYLEANQQRNKNFYPIGLLDDVEIHFIHYKDEDYTLQKWNQRLKRFSTDKLMVVLSERDFCTVEELKSFDTLPYPNKFSFTRRDYNLKSNIPLSFFQNKNEIPGADQIIGFSYWKMPLLKTLNRLK